MTPTKTKSIKQKKCEACNGKGFYTQIFGIDYASDFDFKGYTSKSIIHKIACPKCNWRNENKIVGVQSWQLSEPYYPIISKRKK